MIDKSTLRTILLGMMSCLYMHALFAAEPVTGPHFRIEMRSGKSSIAQQRFIVKKDDIVLIRCSSDARGQLHVHGYRLSLDLKSGETQDLQFKAYGGGILSSKSEIIYSTDSEIPERQLLDPMIALRTPFRIDILQPVYFVIESFDELFKLLDKKPLQMAIESMSMPDYPAKFPKKKRPKKNG